MLTDDDLARLADTEIGDWGLDTYRELFYQAREANRLRDELARVAESRDWYRSRIDMLQREQKRMREPERTLLCDILANCALLPDPARYAAVTWHTEPPPDWERVLFEAPDGFLWIETYWTGGTVGVYRRWLSLADARRALGVEQ